MIPGLLEQIRASIEESARAVLLEKGQQLGNMSVAQLAHELSRNATQPIAFLLESVTEELTDARVEISEATRALETCGVPGAGSLAERIRLRPSAQMRDALLACVVAIDDVWAAINEGTLDMVHMPDDDNECPQDDTCECSVSDTTTKLQAAHDAAKELLK